MNTHVFVVNTTTFKLHLEYMFAGTGAKDKPVPFLSDCEASFNGTTERNLVGMIADISRIRAGDNIIFYLQATKDNPGTFFGVFKAEDAAFFDENDEKNYLISELGKGLSFRIRIAPREVYAKGVTEHEYLDSLNGKTFPHQLCWSLIYRKLKGNRGCTMITQYEYEDLVQKLFQKNEGKVLSGEMFSYDSKNSVIVPGDRQYSYEGRNEKIEILKRLLYKASRKNAFETHLQAYILQHFDEQPLVDLFGIKDAGQVWIGNEVSCGVGMQRIDILIIEKTDKDVHIKVVELKDEEPYDDIIDRQLPWYLEWVAYYIVPNYEKEGTKIYLHPYIVAKKTKKSDIIQRIKTEQISINVDTSAEVCPTEFISFDAKTENTEISFEKV